jgi:GH18 family chitinase
VDPALDEEATSPWLHDADGRRFLTYDDERSIARERSLAETLGLCGVML